MGRVTAQPDDVSSTDLLLPLMRHAVRALDELAAAVDARGTDLPSQVVGLAEAVSTARRQLYAELIRQGWTPPGTVRSGIALDGRLLREPLGSGYDYDPAG